VDVVQAFLPASAADSKARPSCSSQAALPGDVANNGRAVLYLGRHAH
jgi:hypothetical protein